jgi:phosphatidylglycerol:prolipoprotein diacylglycerol transferase
MVFPQSGSADAAHPSQLYQLRWKGCCCSCCCGGTAQAACDRPGGGAFLFGYGLFRFVAEYFREPDAFLGLLALGMSMGQWLCVPMIVAGAGAVGLAGKHPEKP